MSTACTLRKSHPHAPRVRQVSPRLLGSFEADFCVCVSIARQGLEPGGPASCRYVVGLRLSNRGWGFGNLQAMELLEEEDPSRSRLTKELRRARG
jgi:hypothetical protein